MSCFYIFLAISFFKILKTCSNILTILRVLEGQVVHIDVPSHQRVQIVKKYGCRRPPGRAGGHEPPQRAGTSGSSQPAPPPRPSSCPSRPHPTHLTSYACQPPGLRQNTERSRVISLRGLGRESARFIELAAAFQFKTK